MSDTVRKSDGSGKRERATFGGGCFWCTEAVFQTVDGVLAVTSGYAGGETENPDYEAVCTGTTGHAEVVQIEFDPGRVSYQQLLELFFKTHDPTTLDRQGADVGTQYRSIILYHDEQQRAAAEQAITREQERYNGNVVTRLEPLDVFYRAEEYHQDYYKKHPNAGYCAMVIRPKLKKLDR